MQKRGDTMQIHPSSLNNINYVPYSFATDFPIYDLDGSPHSPPANGNHMHYHNCLEIGFCYGGSGIFLVGNRILPFSKGDVSIIFNNQIHIANSNSFDMSYWRFVMIEPNALLSLFKNRPLEAFITGSSTLLDFPHILNSKNHSEICNLVKMIIDNLTKRNTNYKTSVIGLSLALISSLETLSLNFNRTNNLDNISEDYHQLIPALNFISSNLTSSITIGELSQKCSMSESSFRRYFKKVMGTSPMDFIYSSRIKIASQLLYNKTYSISQISLEVGYNSLSSFNRHFKKYTGTSPSNWKNRIS